MKTITFDFTDTIQSANNWFLNRKSLIEVDRLEWGKFGLTVWYTPKYSESKP